MSVLEFISSLKWPVVVLVGIFVVSRGFKRNPDMGAWFRRWLDSRDVRGRVGPAEFEANLNATRDALVTAAASDDVLAAADQPVSDLLVPSPDTTALRRDAVEVVMRTAARWGWDMADMGFRNPPVPVIQWDDDGTPKILFGEGASRNPTPMADRYVPEWPGPQG
ncbi:hypothetical protein RVR_8297 [Actinacidiphila reveromycinica]|uniref:Uncharacterized protein n=1 Tax=Actinacidiphila reveromycinica TaxID=659352 RepID=A0A7U3UY81_9ACTN|nr:hypothetical protein [Streptomyces sp. SN-593]BBB01058.1 hypothetical protein RVR_8297 [Streptomyces sp. SN-593]